MTSMYLSPLLAGSRARSCGAGTKRRVRREEAPEPPRRGAAHPPPPSLPQPPRPRPAAPRRPLPSRSLSPPLARQRRYLHESLYSAFGYVQIGGAQMGALVHGGGRVYQEE